MDAGHGRRRSQRVDLRVPVRLILDGRSTDTETLLVSRHGALVRYPESVRVGTRLLVRHGETGREAAFRVVWVWPDDATEGYKLGLDMLGSEGGFWGDAYDDLAPHLRPR